VNYRAGQNKVTAPAEPLLLLPHIGFEL